MILRMNLYQLRYFVTLAKLQHYLKASEQLCITQPSLSHAISSLEKELGVKLFEKITKISKDATLRYTNGTIIVILPKNSQNISLVIKIIYAAKESMRNEK